MTLLLYFITHLYCCHKKSATDIGVVTVYVVDILLVYTILVVRVIKKNWKLVRGLETGTCYGRGQREVWNRGPPRVLSSRRGIKGTYTRKSNIVVSLKLRKIGVPILQTKCRGRVGKVRERKDLRFLRKQVR